MPDPAQTVVIRGSSVYGLNNKASLIVPIALIQNDWQILTNALIDSGAQGNFIDSSLADSLETKLLETPIVVKNVNGTLNQGGTIQCYTHLKILLNDHPFYVKAFVTNLGAQKFILGDTWLQDVNPRINWPVTVNLPTLHI